MSKKIEEWRPVVGYEGLYEVSDWGNVRSVQRTIKTSTGERKYKERLLTLYKKENNYYIVSLWNAGVGKYKFVHKLVAEAFIPNPENKPTVNHINHIRTDNRIENLEWATIPEQFDDIWKAIRKNYPSYSKKVYKYSADGKLISIYPSTMEVERELGISNGSVSKWCLGKRKDKNGYIWSYNPL